MTADIQGIIFDKDGTLLDFHATWNPTNWAAAHLAAHNNADLAEMLLTLGGYDITTDRVRGGGMLAQDSTREIATQWHHHTTGWELDDLIDAINRVYATAEPAPVLGLRETLDHYREKNIAMGIVTSDAEAPAISQMESLNLKDHFVFIAGYDSGFGEKPEPGALHAFSQQTNIAPENLAFIGDNSHDMETGRRGGAGMVVGVLTGTSSHDDLAPLADHVLESIVDLPKLF